MNEDDDVRWEDPPTSAANTRTTTRKAFLMELQLHPGKWARYVTGRGDDVSAPIRFQLARQGFDVRWEPTTPNRGRLWVRWPDDGAVM